MMVAMVAQSDTDLRSELEVFTEPGGFTYRVPSWADRVDIVMLSGGDGGSVGTKDVPGQGGRAGTWTALTVTSVDPEWDSVISGWVGGGGHRGTVTAGPGRGGDSTVSVAQSATTFPVSAGSETWPGDSPGNISYGGKSYTGGVQQNFQGNDGSGPGGGGAGIVSPYAAAGSGAAGAVWIYAQQVAARTTALGGSVLKPVAAVQFPSHALETTAYSTPGTFNFVVPWWCNAIDVVTLSGGAGGSGGGTASSNPGGMGGGGGSGVWATRTFVKGRDISWNSPSLRVVVGAGGLGGIPGGRGSDGGQSLVSVGRESVYSAGGSDLALTVAGEASGSIDYHASLGVPTYVGGESQVTPSAAGEAPGGGGAGGAPGLPGGAGGAGKVWVVCYQTAGFSSGLYSERARSYALAVRSDVDWSWAQFGGSAQPSAVWRTAPDQTVIYQGRATPYAYAQQVSDDEIDGGRP